MARREGNAARNGQLGRLATFAGFRRNPIDTQGSARSGKKKSQPDKGWGFTLWWRRRESNPRPKILYRWLYMLVPVYCFNRLLPDGQGRQTASPDSFSDSTPGE